MKFNRLAVLVSASVLGVLAARANAAIVPVTDFNFDNLSNGTALPTTSPGVDPQPQHIVYSTGGFPDVGAYTGTNVVGDAGTMSHAAIMTTTQAGTGSNFIDTQFLQTANTETVSFDLDVLATPTTGLPQSATHAPNGQAWVMQAFETATPGNRAWRFVVAPTTATGGIFGVRNNTDGDIIPIGSYTNGDTHHISIVADFIAGTIDASIDNTSFGTPIPFINAPAAADGIDELFIFQNGVDGVTNQVAFDNLQTTVGVPEPTTLALLPLAGLLIGRRRRS